MRAWVSSAVFTEHTTEHCSVVCFLPENALQGYAVVKRGQGCKDKSRGIERVQVGLNEVRWGQFWTSGNKGE